MPSDAAVDRYRSEPYRTRYCTDVVSNEGFGTSLRRAAMMARIRIQCEQGDVTYVLIMPSRDVVTRDRRPRL